MCPRRARMEALGSPGGSRAVLGQGRRCRRRGLGIPGLPPALAAAPAPSLATCSQGPAPRAPRHAREVFALRLPSSAGSERLIAAAMGTEVVLIMCLLTLPISPYVQREAAGLLINTPSPNKKRPPPRVY